MLQLDAGRHARGQLWSSSAEAYVLRAGAGAEIPGARTCTCHTTASPRLAYHTQVWRLVTNFFFLGQLGFGFLMHMMILYVSATPVPPPPQISGCAALPRRKQHSTQLEANSFQNPADFLVMLLICGAALLVMGCFMGMPFLGMGLVFSIVYVWAKENAEQEVNFIFNLATFKVRWTECLAGGHLLRCVDVPGILPSVGVRHAGPADGPVASDSPHGYRGGTSVRVPG